MAAQDQIRPSALIMAAGRKGVKDSVAALQNKSHKCLVEIDGVVMLVRVVETLIESGRVGDIYVSVENEGVLRGVPQLAEWLDNGTIHVADSRDTLADSVLAAIETMPNPLPLMITTGDNALHTPELVRDFMDDFEKGDRDVAVAFSTAEDVMRDFPDVGLAYHRIKGGAYSACNVYGLRNERALNSIRIFEGGGQFGKKHWRILKAFGVMPFILYKLKLSGVDGLMHRIGRNLGVTVDVVLLEYSYGAIDVDNPQFFEITERALAERRLAKSAGAGESSEGRYES